jgi:cell division transport system permease protein
MNRSTRPPNPSRRKAQLSQPSQFWFIAHVYVLFNSLKLLARTPLPNLMTAAVIGIALALPTGLYLLLENVQQVSSEWGGVAQISLFLKHDLDKGEIDNLFERLYKHPDISNVRLINPEEALKEYKEYSGFKAALEALPENPLPAVLVIQPAQNDAIAIEQLLNTLKQSKEVDVAQFDMLWLERLFVIMTIVQRSVLILASLLCLGVLLVIGNTIRLTIYNRREEIEIYKLVGATDNFIRRPFLYMGFWYGFFGGVMAWLIVTLSFWLLEGPVRQLMGLYHSQFEILTLNVSSTFILLLIGALLGLAGAWLAVGRHLKAIQPH